MTYSTQCLALFAVAAACLAGCEGNVNPEPGGNAGSGTTATAGAPGVPAGGASQTQTLPASGGAFTTMPNSSGGAAAGGQPGSVCCMAMAVCDANSKTIAGPEACPSGVTCYSRSICCSTVWCAPEMAQCDAYPSCDAGDQELSGTCPAGQACYSRSLCGTSIQCVHPSAACNPDAEPNRKYVATSTQQCQLVKFTCVANTTMFSNACGCGCEQDASCPEFVDCMPGPGTRPAMCADGTLCPYTLRAM